MDTGINKFFIMAVVLFAAVVGVYRYFNKEVHAASQKEVSTIVSTINHAAIDEKIALTKQNHAAVDDAKKVIADHTETAKVSLQQRTVAEAVVIKRYQSAVVAHQTAAPFTADATETDDELATIRIDWLWDKYCGTDTQENPSCVKH